MKNNALTQSTETLLMRLVKRDGLFSLMRFALVGIIGLTTNICIVYLLRNHINLVAARSISYLIAFTLTGGLNRSFTFRSSDPKKIHEWLRYAAVYLFTGGLHILSFTILVHEFVFLHQNPIWAILFVAGFIAIINFSLSKRFAFKPRLTE